MNRRIFIILLLCITLLTLGCLAPGERQFIKGNKYFDKENWTKAIEQYTEAIEENPTLIEAY
ncbi:MAG: tetratricopeptide repeat protein, partial [Dehalococcoidia bacterium]